MNENEARLTEPEMFKTADYRSRDRLLEAAGVVFSEKGFEGATAREICDLARVNTAAVNYYFGGKKRLYVEVLREAHRRLTDFSTLKTLAEDVHTPMERLEEYFIGILHSMLDPSPAGWHIRVFLREMTSHTEAIHELVELQMRPTIGLYRTIIARTMDLPADHDAVIYGALSTVSQFAFIFQNRRTVELINPELNLKGDGIDKMARHLWCFTVAGLRAVASDAKMRGGA
jgi:TetR/AcrR family transcriptional regulator, regulator of cefoperazone and chloramphenicol sensitivity